jgi:hypothetical protein
MLTFPKQRGPTIRAARKRLLGSTPSQIPQWQAHLSAGLPLSASAASAGSRPHLPAAAGRSGEVICIDALGETPDLNAAFHVTALSLGGPLPGAPTAGELLIEPCRE